MRTRWRSRRRWPTTNPEVVEARRLGIPVLSRAELLAAIALLRRVVAVSGTHGKTTTSSMLALVLVEAGLHPSFIIGGDVNEIGTNAAWDDGDWLVVEADESDGTFLAAVARDRARDERRAGPPRALRLVRGASRGLPGLPRLGGDGGRLRRRPGASELAPGDRHHLRLLRRRRRSGCATSSPAGATSPSASTTRRDASARPARSSSSACPCPGLHNALNAAGALAAALEIGASPADAAAALARFAGVSRRFEFRGEARGVTFVDDYAHLPGEVARRRRHGSARRLRPRRVRLPAAPLLARRRARGGLRRRLRRRGPARRRRHLRGRRGAATRGSPASSSTTPSRPPTRRSRPTTSPATTSWSASSPGAPPRRLLPHARGGRPDEPLRRAGVGRLVVTASARDRTRPDTGGGAGRPRRTSEALAEVAAAIGDLVEQDHPLGARTTYRVGGRAAWYAEPADAAELRRLADAVAATRGGAPRARQGLEPARRGRRLRRPVRPSRRRLRAGRDRRRPRSSRAARPPTRSSRAGALRRGSTGSSGRSASPARWAAPSG